MRVAQGCVTPPQFILQQLSQLSLHYFPIGRAWEIFHKDELLGNFVFRQSRGEKLRHLLARRSMFFVAREKRDPNLAPRCMRNADHRSIADLRVFEKFSLDLSRIHIDAAADEHVFRPAGNVEKAFVIAPRQVSGVEPALFVKRSGGRIRVVPVSAADVRTSQPQFADLLPRHFLPIRTHESSFGEHQGFANNTRFADRLVTRHGKTIDSHLGQSVALLQNHALVVVALDEFDWKWRTAADKPAHV